MPKKKDKDNKKQTPKMRTKNKKKKGNKSDSDNDYDPEEMPKAGSPEFKDMVRNLGKKYSVDKKWDKSSKKIKSKPHSIILDDSMIVGILTITNQYVPIYPIKIYNEGDEWCRLRWFSTEWY